MTDERDLELLIASRFPIIAIETHEEERALELVARCASRRQLPAWSWSLTQGWKGVQAQVPLSAATQEPPAALRHVAQVRVPGVYVLLDFHPFLTDPLHVRLLKEIAADYDRVPRTIVLMGYRTELPPELEKLAVHFQLALPDEAGLQQIFRDEVQSWQKRNLARQFKGERSAYDMLLRHLRGLAEPDVRRLVRQAIEHDGVLDGSDLPKVVTQKHRIFGRNSTLSFEFDSARFADVAGLKSLKAWLERRRAPFLDEAGAEGLDVPKGIMLLGVQGCGKSLAAKAVAGTWGVPLMRLDFAALFNKFVGETERNLREALKAAESMAPCVLWIDEIEKGLAGAGQQSDNGESRRLLGTLLTWMSERRSRVFIVATSNDIDSLPPELVRKGRLDEIFFVDLPAADARVEIFRLHLRKRAVDDTSFDLTALADSAAGFSGAEIEQAVICAAYEARARGAALDGDTIAQEMARTRPLSVVLSERIAHLRSWAADRTVRAD